MKDKYNLVFFVVCVALLGCTKVEFEAMYSTSLKLRYADIKTQHNELTNKPSVEIVLPYEFTKYLPGVPELKSNSLDETEFNDQDVTVSLFRDKDCMDLVASQTKSIKSGEKNESFKIVETRIYIEPVQIEYFYSAKSDLNQINCQKAFTYRYRGDLIDVKALNDSLIVLFKDKTAHQLLINSNSNAQIVKSFTNVKEIIGNRGDVVALTYDGNVYSFNETLKFLDVKDRLNEIERVEVFPKNPRGFIAVKKDGSIVSWDLATSKGSLTSVIVDEPEFNNVAKIFASNYAYMAVLKNGNFLSWGSEGWGAGDGYNGYPNPDEVYDIIQASGTYSYVYGGAMAILRADGRVFVWGHSSRGGNVKYGMYDSDVLNGVKELYSSHSAFAALRHDGSVVSWGKYSGNTNGVYDELYDIQEIYSADRAFLALRKDKKIIKWGECAGDAREDQLQNVTDVVTAGYDRYCAFSVLKTDKSVESWSSLDSDPLIFNFLEIKDKLVSIKEIKANKRLTNDIFVAVSENNDLDFWTRLSNSKNLNLKIKNLFSTNYLSDSIVGLSPANEIFIIEEQGLKKITSITLKR